MNARYETIYFLAIAISKILNQSILACHKCSSLSRFRSASHRVKVLEDLFNHIRIFNKSNYLHSIENALGI